MNQRPHNLHTSDCSRTSGITSWLHTGRRPSHWNSTQLLAERFGDSFDFDPIIVEREYDHDGDEYVHVNIVFDGDQDELDPSWIAGLSVVLWSHLMKIGFDNPPSKSFIEKSEWLETPRVRAW